MGKWEIGEAYNLKLIRSTDRMEGVKFNEDENVFFMMDYFNFLKSIRLQKGFHGYKKLCGLKNEYSEGLAYQNIGIYKTSEVGGKDETGEENSLFEVAGGVTATERPFIGLILVYILDYKMPVGDGLDNGKCKLCNMGEFLDVYREYIRSNIKLNKSNYSIYQTIAGADFCIVVRTDMIRDIFNAATNLMQIKNSENKRIFFTYTNIGIECGRGSTLQELPERILKLSDSVMKKNRDIEFAIRFRIESSVLQDMRKLQEKVSAEIEEVNGLFGRYDLVIRRSISEFYEIYPYLYKNKIGILDEPINEDDLAVLKSDINRVLLSSMSSGMIRTMNIRALIRIDKMAEDSSEILEPWFDSALQGNVKEAVSYIKAEYNTFQNRYKARFLMDRYWYQDICSIFERLINLYEGLAYEFDTYLNWRVYEEYLHVLLNNMDAYMKKIHETDRKYIRNFILEFQLFIRAFDEYIKILQGVNQNTLQAPKYDAVVPFDGQKFLLSYTEYLTQIHEQYCNYPWQKKKGVCQEPRRAMKIVIYPEILENQITVKEVFHYPEQVKTIPAGEQKISSEKGLLICRLPAFEYFARIYDMIPLITHEICHQMLILERKERNEFYINELFAQISNQISYLLLKEVGNKRNIIVYDDLTWNFHRALERCLINQYKEEHPDWADYAFAYIKLSVERFMKDYIRLQDQNDVLNRGYIGIEELICDFQNFIYEVCTDNSEYLEILSEIENSYASQHELQRQGKTDEADILKQKRQASLSRLYTALHNQITVPDEIEKIDENNLRILSDNTAGWKEMDDYICDYYNKQIEAFGTGESEKAGAAEKRQLLKYYVDRIRRLHVLYTNMMEYEPRDYTKLDLLLAEYVSELQGVIRDSYIIGKRYAAYSKDKIDKITRLELFNADRAVDNLKQFFRTYDFVNIENVIMRTETLYRESCADIIMCSILGFSAFGYFRMSVTFWTRMEHSESKSVTSSYLRRQRLIAILIVLLKKEKQSLISEDKEYCRCDINSLKKQIYEYVHAQIDYAEGRIKDAINRDFSCKEDDQEEKLKLIQKCEKFFEIFTDNVETIKKRIKKNQKVFWEDGIWDALCKEEHPVFETSELKEYLRREMNLYTRVISILCMLAEIQVNGNIEIEMDYLTHLERIYAVLYKKLDIHPVLQKVVRFYNDPESEGNVNNEEKMKDLLMFVQDYYFYNRYKNAWERDE